jgi:hypothetical protein
MMEGSKLKIYNISNIFEVDFGKIKSYPNFKQNFSSNFHKNSFDTNSDSTFEPQLNQENLKILEKNSEYEYEVSVLGSRIKEQDNINLNAYGIIII